MLSEVGNHLWQSTLTLAAVAVVAALLRRDGAHVRYWLWWAASVKFLVPFSLLTLLGSAIGADLWLAGSAPVNPAEWRSTLDLLEPMRTPRVWTTATVALLSVWSFGFGAVAAIWAARALEVRALLRTSRPYTAALPTTAAEVEVRTTTSFVEPVLVGISKPVLLLPHGIAERLTTRQLSAVLAHELAHWRRRDNLTAAAHMLVESVFWFHPLVWWLGGRLVEERERACDEAVLRAGHDGRTYAEGILSVCEHYVASKLPCAAGVTGADLQRRVVELTRSRLMSKLPIRKKVLLGTFALVTLLSPIVFGVAQGDRAYVPIVRINPEYPPSALAARLEGEVNLQFTIAANGAVKDIVVVESTAPEFELPAMAALQKWRYQPVTENDQPVEVPGVRTIIRFALK
ncbi:MAG TPA: M56 family metallopeptidase [Gammaproteobacteria bacterium]|nr:M56 family metallopeptidase [Gammaproteobacteria bacterium]